MRLDYLISHTTGLSRKQAKKAIAGGQVTVDGDLVIRVNTQITNENKAYLNGQELRIPGNSYFMLHKPAGYVCSTDDPRHQSVLHLIEIKDRLDLHIVGRLDLDTTGLLLLTSDGQWSHRISSPNKKCAKTYEAYLSNPITMKAIDQLTLGIMLKGEAKKTLPAIVKTINDHTIHLTLNEGRYHQVKRMLAAVDNHVLSLHRLQVGDIQLDENLVPGNYRPLTNAEINST